MVLEPPLGKNVPQNPGAILIVTPAGLVRWGDAAARRWLKEFFGGPATTRRLPKKVRHWLERLRPARRSKSLVVPGKERHLLVTVRHPRSNGTIVLWLEAGTTTLGSSYRKHGALTRREKEVLHWLACGKSNLEIGEILGIATSTVGKHLERVYPKLGVNNRVAAANMAVERAEMNCLARGEDR